jgi:predicted dienelactone hydrolase
MVPCLASKRRAAAVLAASLLASALAPPAARALETVQLQLPLLKTSFTVQVSDLADPRRLLQGNSDLSQLDRATDGAIGRSMTALFNRPLPYASKDALNNAVGTPLLQQVLLMASTLGHIDGVEPDFNGDLLAAALKKASGRGQLTMLGLLQALPGRTASIDVEKALLGLQRLQRQQRLANRLVDTLPAQTASAALAAPGRLQPQRSQVRLAVPHRPDPITVVLVRPAQGGNGRLVLISHGLWDGPPNFEGWANHLASHGYSVLLPVHPGSDSSQQQAMLSGKTPPPGPAELRLRPLDVTAVINAAAAGQIAGLGPVQADRVVVIGHSWGATTAIQLGGGRPGSALLRQRCTNPADPDHNISWVLQCSFLQAADQASLADPRVIAVAAVSPPMYLLFAPGSMRGMPARGLLISGSNDWVVPSGPEALDRFTPEAASLGHQLVLAKGGDHFNLRGPVANQGGPLRALLLAWVNGAFAAGPSVRVAPQAPSLLPAAGWGSATLPLVPVNAAALAGIAPSR